jgi:hypothetical protein
MQNRSVNQYLEEGFLRGMANELWNIKDVFASIFDLISLGQANVYPKVKSVINSLKEEVNNSGFNGVTKDPSLIKIIAMNSLWRFYYYLNDDTFNEAFKRAAKTGVDPTPKAMDTNFHVREKTMEFLNKLNSKKDVIAVLDNYLSRTKQVSDFCQKNLDNTGMRGLLRNSIYGLRDFTIIIRKIISYHA